MLGYRERRRFTPEEYLRLEESAEMRSEYCDGEIFAMTGGSLNHNRILSNLVRSLGDKLAGTTCQLFQSDVRLFVKQHKLFTYPDLIVVCGKLPLYPERTDTLTDARLIVEVLSPSTESYDRGEKFRHYQALPSFVEYVLIAQDKTFVERHLRANGDNWEWKGYLSLEDSLELESLGVSLPLAQLYQDLPLS